MTASLNLTITTDPHQIATDILQEARDQLRHAEGWSNEEGRARAQIRLDMLCIGERAVREKIAKGHPYGTVGATLGEKT